MAALHGSESFVFWLLRFDSGQAAWSSALMEVALGLCLLLAPRGRLRTTAFVGVCCMHLLIAVCIGPLRGNWNNSAWVWVWLRGGCEEVARRLRGGCEEVGGGCKEVVLRRL
jgi:hypothetical protein